MMMITTKMMVMIVLMSMAEAVGGAVARVGGTHVVECGGGDEKRAIARVDGGAGVVRRREYKYS